MNDSELLQDFAQADSEEAFRELVERHGPMVLASARRQMGDEQAARDVAQAVFLILARKAPSLPRSIILAGWLFRTTRFVVARALRAEQRRRQREQQAFDMQQLKSTEDCWEQVAPLLDAALDKLSAADRNAILLRFFEDRTLREVAQALDASEEAAKKRVSRALERLRIVISKQGETVPLAALAAALTANANASPAAGWAADVVGISLAAASAPPGATALATQVFAAWRRATLIRSAAVLGCLALFVLTCMNTELIRSSSSPLSVSVSPTEMLDSIGTTAADVGSTTLAAAPESADLARLELLVVDAVNDAPIPSARVAVQAWSSKIDTRFDLRTDASGRCSVTYPRQTGRLDVGAYTDGWSARYATWPSEGLAGIPAAYTLRVARVTNSIGGVVRAPNGRPVANAEIWFAGYERGDSSHRERPRERFAFIAELPATRTDGAGRWTIGFVPSENPGFQINARHPGFAETLVVATDRSDDPVAATGNAKIRALMTGTLVTEMQPAFTLIGRVVDVIGRPVPGARIQERAQTDSWRTDESGEFRVPQLRGGEWRFTVTADGFSPVRTHAKVHASAPPVVVTLQTGAVLRIRVLDEQGTPVPAAEVGMEQWGDNRHDFEWRAKTDPGGRIEWISAPAEVDIELFARKDGYCYTRNTHARADGEEHTIQLRSGLTVFGRVFDAETGANIPDFRAVPGYGGYGNSIDRWFASSTVRGSNGSFKLTFEEERGPWALRVTADGYEDWTSEKLESGVPMTVDVSLKKASPEKAARGLVLAPDGSPAAGAQVALLTFEHNVNLSQSARFTGGHHRWMVRTDSSGEFRFPANAVAHSVAAVSEKGFGLVRLKDSTLPLTVRLQSWGRIEGVIDPSARAHPAKSIELYDPASHNFEGRVSMLSQFKAAPDAAGRFAFDRVPPGEFSAFINSGVGIPYHHQTPLTVRPGETRFVTIAEHRGARVKGQFLPPVGQAINWKKDRTLIHMYREGRKPLIKPGSEDERRLSEFEFWTSPAGRAYVNDPHVYSGQVEDDGTFVMLDRMPAGAYRFTAKFGRAKTARLVTIPESSDVDLGPIQLQ